MDIGLQTSLHQNLTLAHPTQPAQKWLFPLYVYSVAVNTQHVSINRSVLCCIFHPKIGQTLAKLTFAGESPNG